MINNILNEQVRSIIDISCPKTRIGLFEFMILGSVEEKYPTPKNELSNILKISSGRGDFFFPKTLKKRIEFQVCLQLKKTNCLFNMKLKKVIKYLQP